MQWRQVVTHAKNANQGENEFEEWISANVLPNVRKSITDPSSDSGLQKVSPAAVANKKHARRLHHSVTGALIRELLQHHELRWSPEQRLYICKAREKAAPIHRISDISKTTGGVSCNPSIAGGASDTAIRAALLCHASSCTSLKLPPVQMPAAELDIHGAEALLQKLAQLSPIDESCLIVLLSADSAALGLWRVCILNQD